MGATDASLAAGALPRERWSVPARVAFRFCFVYLGLYCLSNQIIVTPFAWYSWDVPDPATLPPMRQIVFWVAAHVFHFELPLVYNGSGSGDKAFEWTFLPMLLVFSIVATAVWSWFDRNRQNYDTLLKWFRVFIRLLLAGQLLSYGLVKIFPDQMSYPGLDTLVEPFGHFSPMGVLWSSIGSAPHYETFAGSAEALAGLLLLLPRTTLLGALLATADMTQVFMLNMTYDVPVKLLSFHLLLMALFLIAPEAPRLVRFFSDVRSVEPSRKTPLLKPARANRIALGLQLAFGVWLLVLNIAGGASGWKQYGAGRAHSPLYGIWDIEKMTVDGVERAPLTTDMERWRRMIFDYESFATVQTPDDDLKGYQLKIDPAKKTFEISRDANPKRSAHFAFERSAPDAMVLDGEIDGRPVRMELKREDETKLMLVSRGFHWRQDYPFNR
jgi:uncharacterized membrane protein YphA (DoxX/SURF4 family)